MQEQEHPSAGLVADPGPLIGAAGLGKKQPGPNLLGRRDQDPALAAAELGVLDQLEAHHPAVIGQCLVVIAYDESNRSQTWRHVRTLRAVDPAS